MKKEEKCAIQENGTKKQSTEEQSPKEYSPLEESTLKGNCNIIVVKFSVMWGIL